MLSSNPEDPIGRNLGEAEPDPLLRCPLSHGGQLIPPQGGRAQPRCNRESHQMGPRADGSQHHIRPPYGDQIPGPAEFVAEWNEM